MADVTTDVNQSRAMRIAQKRVEGFAEQFGKAHRNLARHAAFSLVLTPDLLYQIWANFVPEAPWVAVAHVLLSRLCRQVGYEMYEMDIADRNLLLRELKEGFGQEKFDELGEFLLDYVAQRLTGDDADTQDLREAQEWTALAYTKPDELARKLAQRLSEKFQQEDIGEVLRLASLVETLAEPLMEAGFSPLTTYSKAMVTVSDSEQQTDKNENTIAAYTTALQVYTREAFPQDWAETQNNLANAYSNRIRGDRADNIEQAIAACIAALQVYTRDTFPQDWAKTQNNLANAYSNRIRGDRADNIEQAIATYYDVLTVRTKEAFPQDWAETKNNLANAYSNRIRGDRAENIEQAIATYYDVLTIRTKEAFPQDWAETKNNLANAYSNRIRGDRADNIEKAIAACSAALTVYTRDTFPQDWAETQNNLANTYINRIRGDRADNIENARNIFKSVIATVELLREEIVSGEESKRKQAEEWNKAYLSIVKVCLELGNIAEAIEYVERSKNRNLVEQILERDSKTIFPPEVMTQLKKYRDEIAIGQYQIQNGKAERPQELAQHLQKLRQQHNELQNNYLPVGYGFSLDSFKPTLDEGTAIIEWYILDDKILAFVIHKGEVSVRKSQSEDRESLVILVNKYLQSYHNDKSQWQNSLGEELKILAAILHIDKILAQIPKYCDKLILIPHRFLHLFPLHALPVSQNSENPRCLLDIFPDGISYAPSCQILQQVNLRKQVDFNSLFAIQNPTEDLAFTDLEVETISSLFADKEILSKKQATQTALYQASSQIQQANYLHFSCHGTFNLKTPQNSCLLLAGAVENNQLDLNKCLTLGNLFEQDFNLNQCRLVVLSACETGLIDFNNESDEYIGFPSGFLYAGCSSIVSSLWTLNDVSTSFLMIKFIQNLKNIVNISVPVALNQAQNWLRNATKEDLQEWVINLNLSEEKAQQIDSNLDWFDSDEKPFQSPYYWAGFCAVGN